MKDKIKAIMHHASLGKYTSDEAINEILSLLSEPKITFQILRSACRYTGRNWKDSDNCNKDDFGYYGEFDMSEEGYVCRSDTPCSEKICPYLKGEILKKGE